MSGPRRGATAVEAIAIGTIALVVLAVILVVTLGSSESIQCPQFPGCLANPGTLIGAVHTYLAGVILLLLLILSLLAFALRRTLPGLVVPSVLAFLALVLAAVLGALFAVGAVPTSWAPIQFVWFALVVVFLLLVTTRAERMRPLTAG